MLVGFRENGAAAVAADDCGNGTTGVGYLHYLMIDYQSVLPSEDGQP